MNLKDTSSHTKSGSGVPPMGRRKFLAGLGAFVTSQVLLPRVMAGNALPSSLKPIRLGFLTDCHAMEERGVPAALARAAELMNSLKPDLIIGGGDFVHGGFTSPGRLIERRWRVAAAFLEKLHARLEPMIGNHDLYEPLLADGSPAPHDPRWRWREHFGLERTYRSFSFRGYRFLMLDSVMVTGGPNPYRGWIDAAQMAWLDRELAVIPRDQPIVLCSHLPFRTSVAESFGPFLAPTPGRVRVLNADAVLSRLKDRPLALILQGHVHLNERLREGSVPCITGGAVCGKWWDGSNMGTPPGLGIIEIGPSAGVHKAPPGEIGWRYLETPSAPEPPSLRIA